MWSHDGSSDFTVNAMKLYAAMTLPSAAAHLLSAVAVLVTTNLVWQFCVFLRHDLYLVLSALLGCVNLWRIAMLTIKRTLAPHPRRASRNRRRR
jgi:hypothetical protein